MSDIKEVKNFMIDIETAGTDPGSVILSVGVVEFNPKAGRVQTYDELKRESLKINISFEDSLKLGFSISASTISWWMNQNETARKDAFNPPLSVTVDAAIQKLSYFLRAGVDSIEKQVWGNGANFDITLLEAYYKKLGIRFPWKYSGVRCYRTIKTCNKYDKALVPAIGIAHDPVDDAIYQIQVLQAIGISNPQLEL